MEPVGLIGAGIVEYLVIAVHISGKHVAVRLGGLFPDRVLDSSTGSKILEPLPYSRIRLLRLESCGRRVDGAIHSQCE